MVALGRINADSMVAAIGLARPALGRSLFGWVLQPWAQPFARQLAEFDQRVGLAGLPTGARWLLSQFVGRLDLAGHQHLPAEGPVLVVANHPGLTDTLVLFAGIGRDDLRIVAADRPFLRALPRVSEHLLYITEEPGPRLTALRCLRSHLRAGGAALTFPGGRIEADPALRPEEAVLLDNWNENIVTLARLCPGVTMVPCVVSGVLSAEAQQHPLTRIRKQRADRDWLGATLQMLSKRYQNQIVRLAFGHPIQTAARVSVAEAQRTAIEVQEAMRRLILEPPSSWETVLTQTESPRLAMPPTAYAPASSQS